MGLIAVAAVVFAGTATQRLTGIGFALLVAPVLVLVSGPQQGILQTNLLALIVGLAVLATLARQVDAGRAKLLVPAGLLGVVPGAALTRTLPPGPLQVAVGALTGLGLLAICFAPRLRARPGPVITLCAGLCSGFGSAVAGAGGPALTVYAMATGWELDAFAATGQISYATQAAAALAIKGWPALTLPPLAVAVTAALGGLAAGQLAAGHVPRLYARWAAIALATAGTLVTVTRGALSW